MKTRTFVVKGIAFVPTETEIHVEASSEAEAMELSRSVFALQRHKCIAANSYDDTAVHSYEPNQALLLRIK